MLPRRLLIGLIHDICRCRGKAGVAGILRSFVINEGDVMVMLDKSRYEGKEGIKPGT